MLLQHVPDRGEHLVRYYGWYSNRARGKRNAEMADPAMPAPLDKGIPEQVDPEASRAARAAWARLIKKVYEADPLVCPCYITDYVWDSSAPNHPSDYVSATPTSRTVI
jgi:hypothetical protein